MEPEFDILKLLLHDSYGKWGKQGRQGSRSPNPSSILSLSLFSCPTTISPPPPSGLWTARSLMAAPSPSPSPSTMAAPPSSSIGESTRTRVVATSMARWATSRTSALGTSDPSAVLISKQKIQSFTVAGSAGALKPVATCPAFVAPLAPSPPSCRPSSWRTPLPATLHHRRNPSSPPSVLA